MNYDAPGMKRFVVLTKTWIRLKHCVRHNSLWYCKLQHVFKMTSFSLDTSLQTFPPLVYHSVRSQPRPSPITASTQPSLVGLLAFCTLVPSCSPEFCSQLGSGPNCPVVTNPVKWSPAFPGTAARARWAGMLARYPMRYGAAVTMATAQMVRERY